MADKWLQFDREDETNGGGAAVFATTGVAIFNREDHNQGVHGDFIYHVRN